MENRIEKIRSFAEKRDKAKIDEIKKKARHLNELLAKVRSFAPRMKELMKLAMALYENGIPLGKFTGTLEMTTEFVSNGWSHKTGFISSYKYNNSITLPIGFGIVGGGACGKTICFNDNGIPSMLFGDSAGIPGVGNTK